MRQPKVERVDVDGLGVAVRDLERDPVALLENDLSSGLAGLGVDPLASDEPLEAEVDASAERAARVVEGEGGAGAGHLVEVLTHRR